MGSTLKQNDKSKKIHLEIIRIIAILFVIFNHTEDWGFLYYSITNDILKYVISFFLSILCKMAVPLFFMVSGALLIDKKESIKELLLKRVFKYGIILVLFSFIQYIFIINRNPMGEFDLKEFIKGVYSSEIVGPYYFIYSYIAILIMLPFIRKMISNMEKAEFLYLTFLQILIIGIAPIVGFIGKEHYLNLDLFILGNNIFYFIMGYFFENVLKEDFYKKGNIIKLNAVGLTCIVISCLMTYYSYLLKGEYSQMFYMNLIAIPAFAVFCFWKYFCGIKVLPSSVAHFIIIGGSNVLGIYLIEDILRNELKSVYYFLCKYMDDFLSCCLWVLFLWILGNIIIFLVRKLPFMKKLI